METAESTSECAAFGTLSAVAAAQVRTEQGQGARHEIAAFYAYVGDDRLASERAIQFLCGRTDLSLQDPCATNLSLYVSGQFADLAGPMAGLKVSCKLAGEDAVLTGNVFSERSGVASIIANGDLAIFVRCERKHGPIFIASSSRMIDIDQPMGRKFYDVNDHFASVVPLVMFLRYMFPDVLRRPQEHGACLMIDDSLLKPRYGCCDFARLRDLMQWHRFTTNIAFIPWNWHRTSPAAADFFRSQTGPFSISIHGCDHVAGEFGTASLQILESRARLAQSRMRNHHWRTGIQHDPVMVFPQGVFSSECPQVLKRNGFVAAVNTDTVPVDPQNSRTRVKDVWDLAIMSYDSFAIFTRRYAFHGLENFAFDLLLGKPCLIASHHDFFRHGGAEAVELIEKLCSLNCSLRWRRLGEVIQRACFRRTTGPSSEDVTMYGTELRIENSLGQTMEVTIRKRESQPALVSEVQCDGKPILWTTNGNDLVFSDRLSPDSQKHLRIIYRQSAEGGMMGRSLRYELFVALRRVLSEFRDDYLSRSPLLTAAVGKFRGRAHKVQDFQ
jgi:hypothetical protein